MKLENTKITFITILSLVGLFFALALTGILLKVFKYGEVPYVDPNPTRQFNLDGTLYFYNKDDKLIGTYECNNNLGYCGYAYEFLDDDKYELDYYDDGKIDLTKVINDQYVFLNDTLDKTEYYRTAPVILYDLKNGKQVGKYKAIKNYSLGLSNNIVIVLNDNNKWQVLSLNGDNPLAITKPIYDYIGARKNITKDNMISSDVLLTVDDIYYQLISSMGSDKMEKVEKEITDYIDSYYISKNIDGNYLLFTVNNYSLLNGMAYKKMHFIGNYIAIINVNNEYMLLDFSHNRVRSEKYPITDADIVTEKNVNGKIEIYINGELKETV